MGQKQDMRQQSLFARETSLRDPLASRLRPKRLEDYVGQEQLLGVFRRQNTFHRPGVLAVEPGGSRPAQRGHTSTAA